MPPSHLNPVVAPSAVAACRVIFGEAVTAIQDNGGEPALSISLPVLAGVRTECLFPTADSVTARDGCAVFGNRERMGGFIVADKGRDLESAAREVYERIFAATNGLSLYRIWNYVPAINEIETGLENYRRFCRGRSHAFEAHFGKGFQRQLPAASAVGTAGSTLAVAFLAGTVAPQHFENPQQVPAFEYPPAYGPRPPSFSRATLLASEARREIFISGTAAIRGHATIAPDDLGGQLACTRENLNLIGGIAGAGADFGAADGWQRSLKIYLRRETDLAAVRDDLERHFLDADDTVTYLRADLCRADLLVEVEAVLSQGTNF